MQWNPHREVYAETRAPPPFLITLMSYKGVFLLAMSMLGGFPSSIAMELFYGVCCLVYILQLNWPYTHSQ